jgi:hypothetical protein
MSTAENLVGDFFALANITNNDLFALGDHHSIYCSSIMSSARAAPAECFYLKRINAICQLN